MRESEHAASLVLSTYQIFQFSTQKYHGTKSLYMDKVPHARPVKDLVLAANGR